MNSIMASYQGARTTLGDADGYDSDFEVQESATAKRKRRRKDEILRPPSAATGFDGSVPAAQLPTHDFAREEFDRFERSKYMETSIKGLNAYEKHVRYVNNYVLWYGNKTELSSTVPWRNDYDIIQDEHRFVWTRQDEANMTWEKEQAQKYYNKLFKEYCLADLSKYKESKIALRWRVEQEVLEGKGHFSCGNISCSSRDGLASWEVNFKYVERGEKRNTLVKIRLCKKCSKKLNYHTRHARANDDSQLALDRPESVSSSRDRHKKREHKRSRNKIVNDC